MHRLGFTAIVAMGFLSMTLAAQEKQFAALQSDIDRSGAAEARGKVTRSVQKGDDKKSAKDKEEDKAGEVDVQFYNGSSVRMVIRSEKLEVSTRFGKLQVPIGEIRSIEFGAHVSEANQTKIARAIKNLGSDKFEDREEAMKQLVELGPQSYAAVLAATRDKELEISRRAKDIVKNLQSKHPKSDLKTSTDDRIVTDDFTIVGKIVTTSVKVNAKYFGEVELNLADMRSLRGVLGPSRELVVSVDAFKFANSGQWMDSKFHSDGRSTLLITAKGLVDQWPQGPGQYMVGPSGNQNIAGRVLVAPNRGVVNKQALANISGGLIGKIGEDGEPFFIGDHFEAAIETEGNLFLHIGPSPWNCQSTGAYEVKISRKN